VLDEITLYWLTNTGASAGWLYWENTNGYFNAVDQKTAEISLPVAVTVFPEEIYRAPETWARRAYRKLIYFHEVDRSGSHSAESSSSSSSSSSREQQPQLLFAAEMRAAFKSLRCSN
jgi:hypothetical protein